MLQQLADCCIVGALKGNVTISMEGTYNMDHRTSFLSCGYDFRKHGETIIVKHRNADALLPVPYRMLYLNRIEAR